MPVQPSDPPSHIDTRTRAAGDRRRVGCIEAYERSISTADAVEHGIKTTAGTVTSAAVVTVRCSPSSPSLPILDMKEMGIGLATAVLIDATMIRGVLLPASMKLLAEWNWYLPNWLQSLPKVEHHAGPALQPAPAAA